MGVCWIVRVGYNWTSLDTVFATKYDNIVIENHDHDNAKYCSRQYDKHIAAFWQTFQGNLLVTMVTLKG
jgi:hypothetical protein